MRKRYKLLIIIFISFILVLGIYFVFKKDNFIYVNLGDNLSINNSSTYNYFEYLIYYYKEQKITLYNVSEFNNLSDNLYKQIINNKNDINYYLKNANIITISLGTSELNNYKEMNEELIINYLNNIYILLNKMSSLNKNIYLINVYNDDYLFINKKINEYCNKFNITCITRDDINTQNIYTDKVRTYLNYRGHKNIADIIVNKISKKK